MANATGTNVPGATRRRPRELSAMRRIEKPAVATTIAGSAVTSRLARKRASRAALPATNWAPTAPAHTIAVVTAAAGCAFGNSIRPGMSGSIVSERRAELEEHPPALAATAADVYACECLVGGMHANAEAVAGLETPEVDVLPVGRHLAGVA